MTSTNPLAAAIKAAEDGPPRRHVITGGPSSGKDDLIERIHAAGIPCMRQEPGREIYRRHRERLGRHLRKEDRREYSLEVLAAFVAEHTAHTRGIRFYNRGIPDGYGWEGFFGLKPAPRLEEATRLHRYDTIFVLDPLDTFEDPDDIVWAEGPRDPPRPRADSAGLLRRRVRTGLRRPRLGRRPPRRHLRQPSHATTQPRSVIPLDRDETPSLLRSPNSILANALLRTIDILRPCVLATRPARIEFVVGTQINGAPHLVQTAAFLLAKTVRREFSIETAVRFGALDNAPHDAVLDPETHHAYQQTYYHALGEDKVAELIDTYYTAFFRSLSEATDIDYSVETYTDQQATPGFRAEFLRTLERLDDIRWWMGRSSPSPCCASRAGAICLPRSSRGCSTPPPGPATSTTTSTPSSGWWGDFSPT